METIDVKCPWCSATLRIRQSPGMESKNLCCPNCKQISPFIQFKKATSNEDESVTCFPGQGSRAQNSKPENLIVGRLIIPLTGISYQLKPGKNIIGRKATASTAHFQIPTGENKRLSREHLIIEVKRVPASGFMHYVSLYKDRVNKTFINNTQLLYGDTLILQHGDVIKLPDLNVRFELPDEEATQL